MRKWISLGTLLLGAICLAEPRVALVAAGRCHDPDLVRIAQSLEVSLKSKLGDELAGSTELAQRFFQSPTRSSEELQDQIEASRIQYYQAQYSDADRELKQALDDIKLLEPGATQWNLRIRAELLRAMVLSATARSAEADESFRCVLRLAPDHALDPDLYPPFTRARFERIRRQVAGSTRVALTVRSSPSDADVFVDGLQMGGKTPLLLELVPGRYTVRVSRGEVVSLLRPIDLAVPTALDVDLDLEASFQSLPFPCFPEASDRAEGIAHAAKLGRSIGVQEVIVAEVDGLAHGALWLLATVVNASTTQKVREGKVQIGGPNPTDGSLELASYLLSGNTGQSVQPGAPSSVPLSGTAAGGAFRASKATVLAERASGSRLRGWRTPLGSAIAGLGVLGVGLGMVFQVHSASAWSEFNSYYSNGAAPSADDLPRVQAVRQRAVNQHTAATVAFAAGAFAAASGLMVVLSDGRADPEATLASLTIEPLPGAIVVSGSIR